MTDQSETAGCAVDNRTDQARPDAVCATCKMRFPAIAVDASPSSVLTMASLRRRLAEQDTVIRRLGAEKDRQLRTITGNLLLLESQLRREKDQVDTLLDEKNRKIAEQDKCIHALLRLNRKLAARASHRKSDPSRTSSSSFTAEDIGIVAAVGGKRPRKKADVHGGGRRRISWHSEVSIYGEDGRRWNASCREPKDNDDDDDGDNGHALEDRFPNIREVSEEEDEDVEVARQAAVAAGSSSSNSSGSTDTDEDVDGKNDVKDSDLLRAADEACDAFGQVLDGYISTELPSDDGNSTTSMASRCQFSRLDMYRLDGGRGVDDGAACTTTTMLNHARHQPPNQLGSVYNRVMSNHRSVIKPKDVKYKKISRVKSRSLEELRGRLKCYTRPVTIGHATTTVAAAATSSQQGYYDSRGACSSAPS